MRTTDAAWIKEVMTHPRIWPRISDDHSPAPEDFEPILHEGLYYLSPEHRGAPVGVFFFHAHSVVCWEIHTCILPEFWGPPAVLAARAAMLWMVDNTACRKIITHVPDDNPVAHRYARRVGMTDEGVNRASFLKGGSLLDQFFLGITVEEIREKCQH